MKVILTLLFLGIILFCGWTGYKKGMIMGVGSLLIFVVSVYFANLLSTTFSGEVIDALRPFASGYVETEIVDKVVRPALGIDVTNLSVTDFLAANPGKEQQFCQLIFENMGIYEATAEQMSNEAVLYSQQFGWGIEDSAVEILCIRVAYAAGFILSFIMIIIVLTAIGNIPNLSFKIPGFDTLNDISGAILGIAQGFCLCLFIAWGLKFTGIIISQEILADTGLVSWFMSRTVLVNILGV